MKIKKYILSLSCSEATECLRSNLREISSSAMRCFDETACYGTVHANEKETTFAVGLGPTGYTTATGQIEPIDENSSSMTYKFTGPFWSFVTRACINAHIKNAFKKHIVKIERIKV